jgi:hypothetical protein
MSFAIIFICKLHLSGSGYILALCYYENSNGPLDPIKGGKFHDQLSHVQLLTKLFSGNSYK